MSDLEKHLISAGECQGLAEAYVKSNYAEINKKRPSGKPDSKMYTISLEVLQDYLRLVSAELDKLGITDKGIRVTLGKYPDQSKEPKLNPKYLGYQMVFFSPVDCSAAENGSARSTSEMEVTGFNGIPNLNFMNLTPPF